jgi:hypothetical protein
VVLGAAISGLATYGYQVAGVRALGEEAYAPVSVLWTVQYLVFAILLFPFESFIAGGPPGRARTCLLWTVVLALVTGAGLAASAGRLPGGPLLLGLGGVAVVLSYGVFTIGRGILTARGDAYGYAVVTAGEAVVRLLLTLPVAFLAPSATAVAWLLSSGPPVVIGAFLLLGRLRRPVGPESGRPGHGETGVDGPSGGGARHLVAGTLAGAGVQLGLAGGTVLVPLLGGGPREVTIAFVALTAARMPVFLALGGLVSTRLPALLTLLREGGEAAVARDARRTVLVVLGLAALAAPIGALVGPPVLALVFGAGVRPPADFVALVAAGVVLASGALLVNQAVLVRERTRRLVSSWLLATTAAAAALFVPGDALVRVGLALLVGQIVGLACLCLPDVRRQSGASPGGPRPLTA